MLGWAQFTKGHKCVKTVEGVMLVVLFKLSNNAKHICTMFRENISKGFRVIQRTGFAYCNLQRGIIL